MALLYTADLSDIEPRQLSGFFVGWPHPPSPERHLEILRGSHAVWLAIDGGRCVGFINAISDGSFSAFIPLLEVLPEFQGRGIGSELVRRMMVSLSEHYSIDVVCDEGVSGFYDAQGFTRMLAMARRNYARQSAGGPEGASRDRGDGGRPDF